MWCSSCQEVWNWREGEVRKRKITRVEYVKYGRRDAIMRKVSEQKKREILYPECRIGRKRE